MGTEDAQRIATAQDGLIRRDQLTRAGMSIGAVRAQLAAGRWVRRTSTVLSTFTGTPTRSQDLWIAVLHGGDGAVLAGLAAAELAGLRHWTRPQIEVYVDRCVGPPGTEVAGVRFVRSRRDLRSMRAAARQPPRMLLQPAVLLWASGQASEATRDGVLAAAVQQRLTAPEALLDWVTRLSPVRHGASMRRALEMIAGGAESKAELDLVRLCRRFGLARPLQQVRRRDGEGRMRFTDAEWRTVDGRTLILEVDGAFHMDVDSWEDDIARQRSLSSAGVILVRCTTREARDGGRLAADLIRLGVPRAA